MRRLAHATLAIILAGFLAGCASTGSDSHQHCVRSGKVLQYRQYCCQGYSDTGHCRGYCSEPAGHVDQCTEWACDAGYVKQEIRKEELQWWQIGAKMSGGAFKCVPARNGPMP